MTQFSYPVMRPGHTRSHRGSHRLMVHFLTFSFTIYRPSVGQEQRTCVLTCTLRLVDVGRVALSSLPHKRHVSGHTSVVVFTSLC